MTGTLEPEDSSQNIEVERSTRSAESLMVGTSRTFEDRWIAWDQDVTHSHGPGGQHAHGAFAFTTWLDFDLACQQAEAVKAALTELWDDQATQFQRNFEALASDLNRLDEQMLAMAQKWQNQPLITSHPVYRYWARRYQLHVKSLHWEPDTVLTDNDLHDLQQLRADHQADWIIWEDEPEPESVYELTKMQIKSVVFRPCANDPSGGDFLRVMQENMKNLTRLN